MRSCYVPRGGRERRLQKALVRWKAPENRPLVLEALEQAGRGDLVGRFEHALRQSRGSKKSARPGRAVESADLDTCG